MTKYNQMFKQQVVDFYFEHHENLPKTLSNFNLTRNTVGRWITQYQHAGVNGLAVLHTTKTYSPEFKRNVVQFILNGAFSMESATLHFGIANSSGVSPWLKAASQKRCKGAPNPFSKVARVRLSPNQWKIRRCES